MKMSRLSDIVPQIPAHLSNIYTESMKIVFDKYEINTLERQAAFLSNICHESNYLQKIIENLNYSAERLLEVFPKYFNRASAKIYANNPEKIANYIYANRMGNGPIISGEGWKYRGRTFIMLTGKDNYAELSKEFNIDFVENPELLISYVCLVAGWYWNKKNLNALADAKDSETSVRKINGGKIGFDKGKEIYDFIIKNGKTL